MYLISIFNQLSLYAICYLLLLLGLDDAPDIINRLKQIKQLLIRNHNITCNLSARARNGYVSHPTDQLERLLNAHGNFPSQVTKDDLDRSTVNEIYLLMGFYDVKHPLQGQIPLQRARVKALADFLWLRNYY